MWGSGVGEEWKYNGADRPRKSLRQTKVWGGGRLGAKATALFAPALTRKIALELAIRKHGF